MKRNKLISKNIALLILALLVICAAAAFIVSYNKLVVAGSTPSILIAILLVATIASGISLFMLYSSGVDQFIALSTKIKQQKSELDKALRTNKKSNTEQKDDTVIDIDLTLEKIMPTNNNVSISSYGETVLTNISKCIDIVQGTFHVLDHESELFGQVASYAFYTEGETTSYKMGETLPGQVAKNQEILNLNNVPEDYITILSGLGKASPKYLLIVPIISPQQQTIGIIEISSFKPFNNQMEELFTKLGNKLGETMTSISQNPEIV